MPVFAYYRRSISEFLAESNNEILGELTRNHRHEVTLEQRRAWITQIEILKRELVGITGEAFFEFVIPRMGKRADVILVVGGVVLVIEFKVGSTTVDASGVDQVIDYALDLKNFHEGSHGVHIVPILIATSSSEPALPQLAFAKDLVATPLKGGSQSISLICQHVENIDGLPKLEVEEWASKGYKPTPTIVEAAQRLYETHSVDDISRSDAGAINLRETSDRISAVIEFSKAQHRKSICFVTGVPGAGKTLAGLNFATRRVREHADEHAVFLSGNGPLVDVLREALTRDKAKREGIPKSTAFREVRSFIQNVHHFRDQYVANLEMPIEKVVIFDEAQRAWSKDQAAKFMQRKRGYTDFSMSEPEFLVSVMDRQEGWCTIICLVGGGQEINTGEAGLIEWIEALESRFIGWDVYVSDKIRHIDYGDTDRVATFLASPRVHECSELHLAVSMRSFRAESVSSYFGLILDNDIAEAKSLHANFASKYKIRITRHLTTARLWLNEQARGTERVGLVASSGAHRLRPEGIFIKTKIEPPNWFLNGKDDVRSSFYLEEVATEFDIQGLELDWVGVCWDADLRYNGVNWEHFGFKGTKWQSVADPSRQLYLKNAYRVMLTRARQGMVIFVPEGDNGDVTRPPCYYDETYKLLLECGIVSLDASHEK